MRILVVPSNEDMVSHLRHPDKTIGRFIDMVTPVEWPHDQFTTRRLEQGDVVKVGDVPPSHGPQRLGPPRFPRRR